MQGTHQPLTLTRREVVASPTGPHPLCTHTEHTQHTQHTDHTDHTDHTERKACAC